MAQRLARLGPIDIKVLASVPEPLFRFADSEALGMAMSRLEGLEGAEKIEKALLAHLATGPIHPGT